MKITVKQLRKLVQSEARLAPRRRLTQMLRDPLDPGDEGERMPLPGDRGMAGPEGETEGFWSEEGEWVENPFWGGPMGDEPIDPEAKYGKAFTKSSMAKRLRWGEGRKGARMGKRINELGRRVKDPLDDVIYAASEELADVLTENFDRTDVTEIIERLGPGTVVPAGTDSEDLASMITDMVADRIRDDIMNVAMYLADELIAQSEDEHGSGEEDEGDL